LVSDHNLHHIDETTFAKSSALSLPSSKRSMLLRHKHGVFKFEALCYRNLLSEMCPLSSWHRSLASWVPLEFREMIVWVRTNPPNRISIVNPGLAPTPEHLKRLLSSRQHI
jgi:hypothetical protein